MSAGLPIAGSGGRGRIAARFEATRREGRAACIAFLTAGDPDPAATPALCEALARAGTDIIELGVPWSDPIADGPVIQRATSRALAKGVGLQATIEIAARVRERIDLPLVLFTYVNPILRMGEETFAQRAAAAGVDGVLVTDLPLEEGASLRRLLIARDLDPILLVAPTSGADRIARAASEARGFIYYIARLGVTGASESLPEGIEEDVRAVRQAVALPVAVGFGISRKDQAAAVSRFADGVVVGSTLVAAIEAAAAEGGDSGTVIGRLERVARALWSGVGATA